MLSVFFWDPPRAMIPWTIPFLERPILWYGFFFALGFFLAYFFLVYLLKGYFDQDQVLKKESKHLAKVLAEKALLYSVVGTLIGARLGDVLFYQNWHTILSDPLSIFRIWEGGLASHGGALGVLIAFWFLFKNVKKQYSKKLSFRGLLDLFCIPIALVAGFIRLGNFFNQEILGTATNLPWGVVFGHPADGSAPFPRHPVQIYESLWYFILCVFLYFVWKKDKALHKQGKIIGLFLVLLFGFRLLVERVKEEQSVWFSSSCMTMGQWLSIPFIVLGLFLLYRSRRAR